MYIAKMHRRKREEAGLLSAADQRSLALKLKGHHRTVRCTMMGTVEGARRQPHNTSSPDAAFNFMHVGAFDSNLGDNLALDNVQHHVVSGPQPSSCMHAWPTTRGRDERRPSLPTPCPANR